jgi:hypothetical protein
MENGAPFDAGGSRTSSCVGVGGGTGTIVVAMRNGSDVQARDSNLTRTTVRFRVRQYIVSHKMRTPKGIVWERI